jgi:hypothetical protein
MKNQRAFLVFLGLTMCFFGAKSDTTLADRVIFPQTDWGRFDLEVWLEGHPDSPWREYAEGPIGECCSQELRKDFSDFNFGSGCLLSTGTINGPTNNSPNGEMSMQLVVDDWFSEPCGDYDCRGEINALWSFMVEDEIVNFQASIVQEVTGLSSLCLYDRTLGEFLMQMSNDHFGEEKSVGLLQPFHEYTLSAYLEASIWDGTNMMTFKTDATFVPEPTTVLFLMLGGIAVLAGTNLHRRSSAKSSICND